MKFRKGNQKPQSNGHGNGDGHGEKSTIVMTTFDPTKAQAAPASTATKVAPVKAPKVSPAPQATDGTADEGRAALKKFIGALTRELREREEKIKALESELTTESRTYQQRIEDVEKRNARQRDQQLNALNDRLERERDLKIAEVEARLTTEREQSIAEMQEAFDREKNEMQVGIGSRVGVDVSTILDAAETTAEEVMAKADAAAEALRSKTEAYADRTRAEAEDAAEQLVSEAETTASEVLSNARAEAGAFRTKMRQVVGEVDRAYKSLGELAGSLAQLGVDWKIDLVDEAPAPVEESVPAEIVV